MRKLASALHRRIAPFRFEWERGSLRLGNSKHPTSTSQGRDEEHRARGVHLLTVVWGNDRLRLFEHALLRSVLQRGNLPRLVRDGVSVSIDVHTTLKHVGDVHRILKRTLCERPAHVRDGIQISIFVTVGPKVHLESALRRTMRRCARRNASMLMAPPDSYFANGSINNLVQAQAGRNVSVAAVHLRVVDEEFLRALDAFEGDIEAPMLDSLALETAHDNVANGFIERDRNCASETGVALQVLEPNMVLVTHRIPTIHLIAVEQSDVEYFEGRPFQAWDHQMTALHIAHGRFKYIGSSDAFFMVELTDAESHLVPAETSAWSDTYKWEEDLHHAINRNFCSVLRLDDARQPDRLPPPVRRSIPRGATSLPR